MKRRTRQRLRDFRDIVIVGFLIPPLTVATADLGDYQLAVQREGSLVSYYTFDGGDASDAVGGNDGTEHGVVAYGAGGRFATGQFLDLDAEGFIGLGNVADFDFADGTGTVEAWIRLNSPKRDGSGNLALFGNRSNGGAALTRYSIHFDDSGMYSWNGTSAPRTEVAVGDNAWHHIAMTFDNAAGGEQQRWYFDGEEVFVHGEGLVGQLGLESTIGSAFSAGGVGNTGENWEGGIDEVAIYADALSAEQIADHFAAASKPDFNDPTDSDADGMFDVFEEFFFGGLERDGTGDFDGDGLSDLDEFGAETDPTEPDSDGDGLTDGAEVNDHGSDPLSRDSDGDGLRDGDEVATFMTDPARADSDGDGADDPAELAVGTDPRDNASTPPADAVFLVGAGLAWDDPNAWSDALAPDAGRDYYVFAPIADRVLGRADGAFPGRSLTLRSGAELDLQFPAAAPGGAVTVGRLVLDGGTVSVARLSSLGGAVEVTSPSTIQVAAAGGRFSLAASVSGGGELTITSLDGAGVDLNGGGSGFTGGWRFEGLDIIAAGVGSLGSGDVFVSDSTFAAGYNISSPTARLTLFGSGSRMTLDREHAFGAFFLGTTNIGDLVGAGTYDHATLVGIDASLGEVFTDGGGSITIGGDVDADGLLDSWEREHFGNLDQGPGNDPDGDGLDNAGEFAFSTDPNDDDSDDDGLGDGVETATGVFVDAQNTGTLPLAADSDGDTLSDGAEVDGGTDPNRADTDRDGLDDATELATTQTDPTDPDTDGDGAVDGAEVRAGTDPNDPDSKPERGTLGGYQAALLGEPSIVGHYSFDGMDATDAVGGHHGTEYGTVAYLPGGAFTDGHYLDLEAMGFIGLGQVPDFDFADGTGTLEAWILLDTPKREGSGNLALFGNRSSGGAAQTRYSIHFDDTGMFSWNGTSAPRTEAPVDDNRWHHVAWVVDSNHPTDRQRFYFDGEEIFVHAQGLVGQLGLESTIGSAFSAGGVGNDPENWEGGIDEVALFADALSAEAIRAHFEAGTFDLEDPTDADGDGMPDNWELAFFGNTSRDGTGDFDNDGLADAAEFAAGADPTLADTDGDGLGDAAEVNLHNSDPARVDTDEDGFSDPWEVQAGSDPANPASVPTVLGFWDFESDDLAGWNIVDSPHGDNAVFTTEGNMPTTLPATGYDDASVQGQHFIRTWDGDVLGNDDAPTGIIETDSFVLAEGARFDFLLGGGSHVFTGDPDAPEIDITALNLERQVGAGDWEAILSASSNNQNTLTPVTWDASAFAGDTVRLRIYDTHSGGWGHIDVDNIRYTGRAAAGPDTDGDGLTDEEEDALGTDRFNPDTDGDGFGDGVEVAAGTDPNNAADLFAVAQRPAVSRGPGGELVALAFTLPGSPAISFDVWFTVDLVDPAWEKVATLTGGATFTDESAARLGGADGFYRVTAAAP